ncbi:MAG: hypothetical protein NVSMB45_01360 [Ginsengibacter sp.]
MKETHLNFLRTDKKEKVEGDVSIYIQSIGFHIVNKDFLRPWGGFFVLDESQAEKFITIFFPELKEGEIDYKNKLSPKILVVAPDKRLSWQYHYRRSEIWKLIGGTGAVGLSDNDEEKEVQMLLKNKIITLAKGQRHRLIGTETWGIVAEIWNHTDSQNPSNEDDIVRVQDDFGR